MVSAFSKLPTLSSALFGIKAYTKRRRTLAERALRLEICGLFLYRINKMNRIDRIKSANKQAQRQNLIQNPVNLVNPVNPVLLFFRIASYADGHVSHDL